MKKHDINKNKENYNSNEFIDNIKKPNFRHKKMPMSARAAQFAPFSALAGLDEAIFRIIFKYYNQGKQND